MFRSDASLRQDALAATLSRAVVARRPAGGALLMRDPTSAAKALHAAGVTKFNRGTFESWLAQVPSGGKKPNATLHSVSVSDLNAVRSAFTAAGTTEVSEPKEDKPRRYQPPPKEKKVKAVRDWEVPTKRPTADEMTLEYGAKHGNRHFIKAPTKNKTAWTLPKAAACDLMEAEINNHLERMIAGSALDTEWDVWYVIGDADADIGLYKIDGEREPGATARFACQVQVSLAHKLVSYHGYPDEQAMSTGAGRSRDTVS
jgi:hypothetical protein